MAHFHEGLEVNRKQGGEMAICFIQQICHGGDRLQSAPPLLQCQPP